MKNKPELTVQQWLNTDQDLSLQHFKGKVVVVFAFQMLCPGCVEYSLPQAKKVDSLFSSDDIAVLGLHTVFEQHAAMTEVSLRAFLTQYGIKFPVGIDMPASDPKDPIPITMRNFALKGTPSLLIFDKNGHLRINKMGHEQDLILGAQIASLINEKIK